MTTCIALFALMFLSVVVSSPFSFFFFFDGLQQPQLGSSVYCLFTVYLTSPSKENTHVFWSWVNPQRRRPQPRELLCKEKLVTTSSVFPSQAANAALSCLKSSAPGESRQD